MIDKHRGAAWVPCEVQWWPAIAEALPKPWPKSAVYFDLRCWDNAATMGWRERPSRATLRARWGWSDKRVRLAISAADKWRGQARANQGPAKGQLGAKQGPETSTQTPVTTSAKGQARAKEGPAKGQARAKQGPDTVALHAHEEQTTNNKQQRTKNNNKERAKALATLWDKINKVRGGRALKLNGPRTAALKARIAESSEADVLTVVQWRETSLHPRAVTLRDGGYGIDTLLKASKFCQYLEMASGPAPTNKKKAPTVASRMIASLRDDIAPLQAVEFEQPNQQEPIEAQYEEIDYAY